MDQAEEIRRRLEARTGTPVAPATSPSSSSFQAEVSPTHHHPAIAETARQRKMEAAIKDPARATPIIVVDVKIKFWSLVVLMIKVAFAAIPAILVTTIITATIWGFVAGLLGGLLHR